MINIRPISDLRNKFTEIEKMVKKGEVVHLTKNGYGSMVVMSTERYSQLLEAAGKEAEQEENCQWIYPGYRKGRKGSRRTRNLQESRKRHLWERMSLARRGSCRYQA
ncbi:MAG: type II toxin-antitoxin system prevent-host-death family antitoxin [[Clostridium] scindens]